MSGFQTNALACRSAACAWPIGRTRRRSSAFFAGLAAFAGLVSAAPGGAADPAVFPNRPLRIVLAFSGGVGENLARMIGERLERALGQPVVVEPKPGASGTIANELVA